MSRDMTITIYCDYRGCTEEFFVDLDDGNLHDDDEMKIEKALEKAGWYINMDGEYCKKHAEQAKKEWSRQ